MGALRSVPLKAGVWAALFVLQVLLMIFFVTGEDVHEYLAFPFAGLAVLHMAIASWWLKTFGRQFATPRLALNSGVDLALIAALLLALFSGLLISRYALPFLRVRAWQPALLPLHMTSTFWLLMLCLVHAGLHMEAVIAQLWRRPLPLGLKAAFAAGLSAVSAYGVHAFLKLEIWKYLLRRVSFYNFDADIPALSYLLDFTSVAVAIAACAALLGALLKRILK